ncbi:MAG: NAD(+) kinase [Pseudomonadota bacterium]
MKLKFQKIGILGKPKEPSFDKIIIQLADILTALGAQVAFEIDFAERLQTDPMNVFDLDTLCRVSDLLIVIGGDGSILHAARAAVRHDTPILGIHRGRLGFLTDICPQDISTEIPRILMGDYLEEPRFLLEAQLISAAGEAYEPVRALNDIVLHSGEIARMIEYELWVDGVYVCRQRSDGLIVSTPTGSTAYALSGGGPILHPSLDAIALVPMNPHTLSSRPLVVRSEALVQLRIPPETDHLPKVTCDGQVRLSTAVNDVIEIRRYPTPVRLIHPMNHDYFKMLRDKLGWGSER